MGEPREPPPALGLIAILHREPDALAEALGRLGRVLGPLSVVGPGWDFAWTDYYDAEMGPGLRRGFLRLEALVPRELLGPLKRLCTRLERDLEGQDGRRRVNLDPGLLCSAQWVLATTKARPHRVYLGQGIWAEATLVFERGAFQPLPWTYPDYRAEPIRDLLAALRLEYKEALGAGGPRLAAEALRTGERS
jgi:hypothetical protein